MLNRNLDQWLKSGLLHSTKSAYLAWVDTSFSQLPIAAKNEDAEVISSASIFVQPFSIILC